MAGNNDDAVANVFGCLIGLGIIGFVLKFIFSLILKNLDGIVGLLVIAGMIYAIVKSVGIGKENKRFLNQTEPTLKTIDDYVKAQNKLLCSDDAWNLTINNFKTRFSKLQK